MIIFLLAKIDKRFQNQIVEFPTLSMFLDPSDTFNSFNFDDIFNLVKKFYPPNFTQKNLEDLRRYLKFYEMM